MNKTKDFKPHVNANTTISSFSRSTYPNMLIICPNWFRKKAFPTAPVVVTQNKQARSVNKPHSLTSEVDGGEISIKTLS